LRAGFQRFIQRVVPLPVGSRLGTARTVQVAGQAGVPAAGVVAVAVNVTAVGASASGFVTVYPDGQAWPGTSNVNYTPGAATSNAAIVALSGDGKLTVYASQSVDVIVDIQGWYTAGATTAAFGYDANGSRCWATTTAPAGAPTCATPPGGATRYTWDALNRLTTVSSGTT
jgi:hypothetical protein